MNLPAWWSTVTLGLSVGAIALYGLLRMAVAFFWCRGGDERATARGRLWQLVVVLALFFVAAGALVGNGGLLVARPAAQGLALVMYYLQAGFLGVISGLFAGGVVRLVAHFYWPPQRIRELLGQARTGK